jgi:hypothetical protein
VQDISLGAATLTRANDLSQIPLSVGELLYSGDTVRGDLVLIAECRGKKSELFVIKSPMAYVAGQQSVPGSPLPDCQLPQVNTSLTAQHIDATSIHDAPLDKKARQDDVDQVVVESVTRALGTPDPNDKLYALRLALALEQQCQLSAAIVAYDDLQRLWPKAPWILPKQNELKDALRAKLLKAAAKGDTKRMAPVVIGISNYKDPAVLPQLNYAALDGTAFADYLNRLGDPLKEDLLTNPSASKANIVAALARLKARTLNGGTAVVFISGHGFHGVVDSYILPYDSYWREVSSTAIPVADILAALKGAAQAYLFIDACRAEAEEGVHDTFQKLADSPAAVLADRASASRIFVFLSSGPGKVSRELPERRHGAFTYYLLKALTSQTDQTHAITRDELAKAVERAMESIQPEQRPREGGNFPDDDLLDPLRALPAPPPSGRNITRSAAARKF